MSHQQKKRRLDDDGQNNDDHLVTLDALSTDELVLIFEYLSPENIMLARLNKKMRDAATKTVVPIDSDIDNAFYINSVRKYHLLVTMATALPNLQQIEIGDLDNHPTTHKYNDGEDPDAYTAAVTANRTTYDIGILSIFTRLRELKIDGAPLNGRYPMLFNFPLLQKLHIDTNGLKWDLGMLVGLPSLKELISEDGRLSGNIRSLRVLKDTLSKIVIEVNDKVRGNLADLADFPKLKNLCLTCFNVTGDFEEISKDDFVALQTLEISCGSHVRGNFMNLSDIPHLKVLNLWRTNVTGDIRDVNIGNDDFQSLESLKLPPSVYGGCGFQFQRISDAPDVIAAVSSLMKQRPNLQMEDWYARLSCRSPERYDADDYDLEALPFPPLKIEFVKAGSRLGWRWTDQGDSWTGRPYHPCEINWLDPEPSKESDDYENFIHESAEIEKNLDAYKGFYQPPTEEEYRRLYKKYVHQRIRNM